MSHGASELALFVCVLIYFCVISLIGLLLMMGFVRNFYFSSNFFFNCCYWVFNKSAFGLFIYVKFSSDFLYHVPVVVVKSS